jgi:hypothetical protein
MTPYIPSFASLEDCCCMNAPRVLFRSANCMAFNFSAVPEKVPQMHSQANVPRTPRQVFSRLDFFPAY